MYIELLFQNITEITATAGLHDIWMLIMWAESLRMREGRDTHVVWLRRTVAIQ